LEGKMLRNEGALKLDCYHGLGEKLPDARPAADRDSQLVLQLRRHETGAVEALVDAYGDRVYRLAIRITGNTLDAEEVAQDALWTASRKIDTFQGAAAFGSWLYRITANTAYQKLRTRRSARNEVPWEQPFQPSDESRPHTRPALDWSAKAYDAAMEAELRAVLESAIDALPDDHRVAFLLRDVEGLTTSEIASMLNVGASAIKSRLHRARLFLRRRLDLYLANGAPEGSA
jgi:RNA polymerase sigma-70 factor (ECF subfamily)